ncbi:uncharacterized protein LOC104887063 [Beta vulgaris subsp. vulgaris]|uniref:uncharacterized protein LOC104887063 n=1 Tax=Beta vulgaris subsp. vulgaris TaxID=3555 RepID=UPI00254942A6|nr:uncharacterized protein LOC104887063 [Beta vulgaris subsp. vulgaris]XP_019103484.2 uncharacterized protein LOC104887063 [Beta vulgaris subsp. vulgaris]XP_019103485.2 uncharacterized protein LOC104887063 [Beta vulgaris subsp. vulgaris]XP_019103486.2 uncharacterized protein LOC104887063 [Beta vulgaris subsp. vulgaris]XP_048494678.2 uncharacterized protein LOC104887063 [Beta vulgaris subsp. vulgaris]XP_048494679.2 uncharacterized protein LOC104887063 [Beta vulgaris subsp. vulgaris]XP_04849468
MIILSGQDVFQLLTGEWLNVSILQVFMMYLSDDNEVNGDSNIGFMCPSMISETMLRHEPDVAINYMQRTMKVNREMTYIMLPYIEKQHWILLVLSLSKKTVYVFDSLKRSDRSLAIKEPMHTAYTSFMRLEGIKKATKLSWISMKCAQQTEGDECGYFVMKYMYLIVRFLYESNELKKDFPPSVEPYTIEDINELKDHFAQYFKHLVGEERAK